LRGSEMTGRDDWYDPNGCQDVSTATDYIAELEAENERLTEERAFHVRMAQQFKDDKNEYKTLLKERDKLREQLADAKEDTKAWRVRADIDKETIDQLKAELKHIRESGQEYADLQKRITDLGNSNLHK